MLQAQQLQAAGGGRKRCESLSCHQPRTCSEVQQRQQGGPRRRQPCLSPRQPAARRLTGASSACMRTERRVWLMWPPTNTVRPAALRRSPSSPSSTPGSGVGSVSSSEPAPPCSTTACRRLQVGEGGMEAGGSYSTCRSAILAEPSRQCSCRQPPSRDTGQKGKGAAPAAHARVAGSSRRLCAKRASQSSRSAGDSAGSRPNASTSACTWRCNQRAKVAGRGGGLLGNELPSLPCRSAGDMAT